MQNWPKRHLPQNKTPVGTRCIQITIPDDDEWENMLYSEAYQLSLWMLWDRDEDKNGTVVARQWRRALQTWQHCDGSPTPAMPIEEMEYQMSICEQLRFENGVLQGLCCGEWTDIMGQPPGGIAGPNQPGGGGPAPAPGGGCTTYHVVLDAAKTWLLPPLVQTGDVLHISNAKGSANATGNAFDNWYCPDGSRFVANECLSWEAILDGSAPVPTANFMSIIGVLDGPGAFSIPIGSDWTVPGGVDPTYLALYVNDSDITNNLGGYTFDLQVCNNAPATWSHTLDFRLGTYGFQACGNGAYIAGVGFNDTLVNSGPNSYRGVNLCLNGVPAFTLTRAAYICNALFGTNPQNVDLLLNPGNIVQFNVANVAGAFTYDTGQISRAGITTLELDNSVGQGASGSDPGGTLVITGIVVSGSGPDPFA